MTSTPLSPTVVTFDATGSVLEHHALPVKTGVARGNFAVVAQDHVYIALEGVMLNGTNVPAGSCFIFNSTLSVAHRKRAYTVYRDIYRAMRALLTYAKGWATVNLALLGDLHALAKAYLDSLFGVATLDNEQVMRLYTQLKEILEKGGKGTTSHTSTQRAIVVLFNTITKTRRGSQLLGFGNSKGRLETRIEEVAHSHEMVVSLGTLLAHYLGCVLDTVRQQRDKVKEIMGRTTVALLSEETAHDVDAVQFTLRQWLLVRPTVRGRERSVEDCAKAAVSIRSAAAAGEAGSAGASEGVRNLLGNVLEQLDLLLWQHRLEIDIVTPIADAVRTKAMPTSEAWAALATKSRELGVVVQAPFGAKFANRETMPTIRRSLVFGAQMLDDLAKGVQATSFTACVQTAKEEFIEASDAVAGRDAA